MSGDDLPEFVGRVLRAANTSPPAKVTISSSAVTEPTTAEERARIVALLRKWADDAVAAKRQRECLTCADIAHLSAYGYDAEHIGQRLGIRTHSVYKHCRDHGLSEVNRVLLWRAEQ